MVNQKLIKMPVLNHLICYLISYIGLVLFYILFDRILNLFPSFSSVDSDSALIITYCMAYGFTAISLIIYLWNSVLREIVNQFKVLKNILTGIEFGVVLIVGTIVIQIIVSQIANMVNLPVNPNDNEDNIRRGTISQPILSALMSIIFAPFTEEIGYRLGIFGGISKYNRVGAYIVTALFFSLIHFNFESENIINELFNLPSYIFAGAWLCFCYDYNGSIATSITAHMFNNLVAFVLTFIE